MPSYEYPEETLSLFGLVRSEGSKLDVEGSAGSTSRTPSVDAVAIVLIHKLYSASIIGLEWCLLRS